MTARRRTSTAAHVDLYARRPLADAIQAALERLALLTIDHSERCDCRDCAARRGLLVATVDP